MLANGSHNKKDCFPFYCLIDYQILDQLLYSSLQTWLYFALVVISVIISVYEIIDMCNWCLYKFGQMPGYQCLFEIWQQMKFVWSYFSVIMLTHCGLVTPYGDRDLGQHWLRQWLVAWLHQAITWTNVDLSSVRSSGVHLRPISQEIPQPSVTEISLKITCLKFHSNP